VAFFFSIEVSSGLFILESQYFVTNMQVDTNVLLLLLGVRENRSCIHSQSLWEMNVLSSCFHQIYLDEAGNNYYRVHAILQLREKKMPPCSTFLPRADINTLKFWQQIGYDKGGFWKSKK
jgi:hypothetical protein